MQLERSAGVLLYHDDDAGQRRFLLLDYGSHWDYPKGHVEPGEDDPTAARRELQEETGIAEATFIEDFSREINYVFRSRKGGLIKKTVIFFLARTGETAVTISHEHVGFGWMKPEEALKKLTYPNARALMEAAQKHLQA